MIPLSDVLFQDLRFQAGSDGGAREIFQSLITDLVFVDHPTASEVAGPGGGDWGIDTYVGSFDGSILVWQSKFFLAWRGEDQRKQVRASLKQLLDKAAEKSLKIDAWTLCVPCILPPDEQKWFDGWAARQLRDSGIQVTMQNGPRLRRQLMRADATDVYKAYFAARESGAAAPIQSASDLSFLADALFVQQLEAAGHPETDAARGLFFAAEALVRDVIASGDPAAGAAMEELHLEIQSIWEQAFNEGVSSADGAGRIDGLVLKVLDEAARIADPGELRLRPVHRRGIAHRLVEDSRAGWVKHWREIAGTFGGSSAGAAIATYLAARQQDEVAQ